MVRNEYKVSAPGSMLLLGEHAVLHGKTAIVSAIDKRITVTLKPRDDKKITITSALGKHKTTIDKLKQQNPFQFILAALIAKKNMLRYGCDIEVDSAFSDQLGLGSSAAVTVATVAALTHWLEQQTLKPDILLAQSKHVVHEVQGFGSGADCAASIYGGVIAYKALPLQVEKLPHHPPLTVVYCGYKIPTQQVVEQVEHFCEKYPLTFADIYAAIDKCSQNAIVAIQHQDWEKLGEIINIHQGLMDAIGVNDVKLTQCINTLRRQPSIYGAKISGSGLGDCIYGIGTTQVTCDGDAQQIAVNISEQGLRYE